MHLFFNWQYTLCKRRVFMQLYTLREKNGTYFA